MTDPFSPFSLRASPMAPHLKGELSGLMFEVSFRSQMGRKEGTLAALSFIVRSWHRYLTPENQDVGRPD
jgi:hypothetical protein